MKKMMTLVVVSAISAMLCILSGCSTVKGFGQDVQKGGREIQRAAS
jgi:predicted small secreted protein